MEKAKNILNVILVILTAVAMLVIGLYAYYSIFVKETTIGINNIGDQSPIDILEIKDKQKLTQEEIDYYENRYFFVANVFDNANKNGEELYELRLDYFTDYTLEHTACRSTGMQLLGAYTRSNKTEIVSDVGDYVSPYFTYYDTANMVSWQGGNLATQLNRNTKLIIKIDNKPYQIQLTGYETITNGWWIFQFPSEFYYLYSAVFLDVMDLVKSNSLGYGDYYTTVNLTKYFTVYAFDENKGKFVEDDITDEIFNYAVIKFHYEANGVTKASQSMFGQINCNSKYGEDNTIDTNYWQERVVFNLTESDLEYRSSDIYGGQVAYLSAKTKETLSKMQRAEINVILDVDSKYFSENNINFVGFDFGAFENVAVNKIRITGSKNIYFLENSLKNTKLKSIERSKSITLNFDDNAYNSAFSEVAI